MNQIIIIGGLTRDPETRTTQSGKEVCSFTVGVNRKNDKEKSDYFRVNTWDKLADTCKRYLTKGKKVAVTGRVSVSTYTTKDGETRASMDVFAESVYFLSPVTKTDENAVRTEKTDKESGYVQVNENLPWEGGF